MSDEIAVFVVDDDEAAANSLAALIASVGFQFEVYRSAEDFLAAYHPGRDGCLVLDLRLKGMSGLELQEALISAHAEIPIIVISGHADRELIDDALKKGAVACLEKPFDGKEFCAAVRAALTQRYPPERFLPAK